MREFVKIKIFLVFVYVYGYWFILATWMMVFNLENNVNFFLIAADKLALTLTH